MDARLDTLSTKNLSSLRSLTDVTTMDSTSTISTSSTPTNDDTETLVTHNFPPFFKVYKDGRIQRHFNSTPIPPGIDPVTAVQSKDIPISTQDGVSARIFLPPINNNNNQQPRLPLVIHYHGGGFCCGSPFDSISYNFLNLLTSKSNAVILSVDYRLAPEHPLPIAYDDSYSALKWAVEAHSNGTGPEPWLNDRVDFNRVFLAGESAGGNIAHDVAIRAGNEGLTGGKIVGLMTVHPFFVGKEIDEMYKFLYPGSSGSEDEPRLNPSADMVRLEKLGCERVLVYVAEKDGLKERGVRYYETLRESGWKGRVELEETVGEDHCFYLFNLESENREPFVMKLAHFINRDD